MLRSLQWGCDLGLPQRCMAGLLSAECERIRQSDIGHSQGAMQAFEAGTLVREADTRDARGMIPDRRRASLERVYGGEA